MSNQFFGYQYEIFRKNSLEELTESVNHWLGKGAKPIGGIAVISFPAQLYLQAMAIPIPRDPKASDVHSL